MQNLGSTLSLIFSVGLVLLLLILILLLLKSPTRTSKKDTVGRIISVVLESSHRALSNRRIMSLI